VTEQEETLQSVAAKLGVGSYTRHVFLCTGPNCCSDEVGQAAWEALKTQLKQRELVAPAGPCYRTRVGCLRICQDGPTMLVYPEGTWYHGMTAERIPQFVAQHLIEDKPVEDWIFAHNPLQGQQEPGQS
jgi:(2Fe-2S) ferredoxin